MKSAIVFLLLLFSFACGPQTSEDAARRHPDAAVDAPPGACDPTRAGCVACAATGNPNQACSTSTTASMCCFANDLAENGTCQDPASACAYGSEHCDGTEDCPTGWKCWANERDLGGGQLQWSLACSSSQPQGLAVYQMCHPNSFQCLSPQVCMPAHQAGALTLPAELYVCH